MANRPPTLIEGKDGGRLIDIDPSKTNWSEWAKDKNWMTVDYSRRYYHWKNHK